jgi:hypothetical protein
VRLFSLCEQIWEQSFSFFVIIDMGEGKMHRMQTIKSSSMPQS